MKRFQNRRVAHGKKDSFRCCAIDVAMRIPKRDNERVSLLPIEALVTNIARTAAAKGMVDDCARVPMRLGFFARAEKLKSALDGRHGRAACHWVAKLQNISVKSIRWSCFNQ